MFYKVISNGRVIDVLQKLIFLKHQKKHNIMVLCEEDEAQAFLSSDGNRYWHTEGLYNIPAEMCDTVQLVEIDQYEYESLKILNGKTPEEIIDEYTLYLIDKGVI